MLHSIADFFYLSWHLIRSVLAKNLIGFGNVELPNIWLIISDLVFDLMLMMLKSLLTGLRGHAAMQAEMIALRHQLTVFQRTQKPRRLVLNRSALSAENVWIM
jgi:hypothetical protein